MESWPVGLRLLAWNDAGGMVLSDAGEGLWLARAEDEKEEKRPKQEEESEEKDGHDKKEKKEEDDEEGRDLAEHSAGTGTTGTTGNAGNTGGGTTTPPAQGGGARVTTEAVYWHHNDHLGTPQAMTDANGTVAWTASYTPFGIASVNEDPDGDGIRTMDQTA